MPDAKKQGSLLQFITIFLLVYLGSQFLLPKLFPQLSGTKPVAALSLTAPAVSSGNTPVVTLHNGTSVPFAVANRCPRPPVDVWKLGSGSGARTLLTASGSSATKNVVPCDAVPDVPPNGTATITLAPWKYSLFAENGSYDLRLPVPENVRKAYVTGSGAGAAPAELQARLEIREPGMLSKIFRTFISAPFLNLLIFFGQIPGHSLGLAIILLTIAVKLLLFLPTQHALEGQRKMQLLQPKMEEIKRKYPNDPQRVQQETMKLWKDEKVNPFQSCLPTLIQFPILIGLYYVVRDHSTLELSRHLIYPFFQHLSWKFSPAFLGLDLLKPNLYVLPPLLVVLQYLQMKLTFSIAERKKSKADTGKVIDAEKPKKDPLSQSELQQKIFLYAMPLMIGFFAIQFPAAVSIYWGVSTLFAIVQQIIVNREHLSVR